MKAGSIILAEVDESAPYEVDQTYILWNQALNNFSLITASGCSCWEGDYEETVYECLDELYSAVLKDDPHYKYNPSLVGAKQLVEEAKITYDKIRKEIINC